MLNNRKYTDKENIDYILLELDERFDTARAKLEQKVGQLPMQEKMDWANL